MHHVGAPPRYCMRSKTWVPISISSLPALRPLLLLPRTRMTSPMSPFSIMARMRLSDGRTVAWWLMASFTPALAHASTIRSASARSKAMGFSQSTCTPCSAAATVAAQCWGPCVAMATRSSRLRRKHGVVVDVALFHIKRVGDGMQPARVDVADGNDVYLCNLVERGEVGLAHPATSRSAPPGTVSLLISSLLTETFASFRHSGENRNPGLG